jgi:hypothetical protein
LRCAATGSQLGVRMSGQKLNQETIPEHSRSQDIASRMETRAIGFRPRGPAPPCSSRRQATS